MDVSASGSASAAGESTGDDGGDDKIVLSSHKKQKVVSTKESTALTEVEIEEQKDNILSSHNEEISLEQGEIDESQEPGEEEEVDIINVSDKETAEEGGGGERSMEIKEQKDVSIKESTRNSESSESDGDEETEPRIFQNLPPNFPSRFKKLIEDPESIRPRILTDKRLHKADVDGSRNQLTISRKKMVEVFLLPEEEAELKSGEVMKVQAIEPDGETVSSLTLRWRKQRPAYVLTGAWNEVVARNNDALKRGGLVRVWYFRVNGELWFALEVVEEGKQDREIAKQMSDKWYRQNVFAP